MLRDMIHRLNGVYEPLSVFYSGDGEVDPAELLLRYLCVATTYARFHEMQENMREKLVLLRKRARVRILSFFRLLRFHRFK